MEYLGDTAQVIQAFKCEMWPLTYTTHTHTLSYGHNTTPVSLSLWSSVQFKWEGKSICYNTLDKPQLHLSHPA